MSDITSPTALRNSLLAAVDILDAAESAAIREGAVEVAEKAQLAALLAKHGTPKL